MLFTLLLKIAIFIIKVGLLGGCKNIPGREALPRNNTERLQARLGKCVHQKETTMNCEKNGKGKILNVNPIKVIFIFKTFLQIFYPEKSNRKF